MLNYLDPLVTWALHSGSASHCDNYVVIKPGFTKKEAIAKKIIHKINENDLINLDDVIRVLPSGKCDIDEEYHQRKKI